MTQSDAVSAAIREVRQIDWCRARSLCRPIPNKTDRALTTGEELTDMTEKTGDRTLFMGRRSFLRGASEGGPAVAGMPTSEAVCADTGKVLNVRS